MKIAAGETLRYAFAVLTFGVPRSATEFKNAGFYKGKFAEVANQFGFSTGISAQVLVGRTASRQQMFYHAEAENNEAVIKVEPVKMMIDLPIRVDGISDNGAAAVYSSSCPFFRYIGVADSTAYLQERVDEGAEIWVGNVFICDNPDISFTVVGYGVYGAGRPYVEVFNASDNDCEATVRCPQNLPVFSGYAFAGMCVTRRIPAGSSTKIHFDEIESLR